MRYSATCAIVASMAVGSSALAVGEPIAWWTFDQISGDTAINEIPGIDGALAAPAAMVAGGASGGALDVRNGGWANMGLNYDLLGTAFSMQTWIRTTDTSSNSTIIAGKHVTGTFNGYMMRINQDTASYGLPTRASFYQSNSPGSTAVGTSSVTDDEWHHLVSTYTPGGS
ncbi:MAG TPA: LamG-like jellyroll fold domain-containing protein, partial [Phycisphaerales bacterium]|nr:LamG-like jellyroll fold domain-containing protein [Phycisphaerales bacterium]